MKTYSFLGAALSLGLILLTALGQAQAQSSQTPSYTSYRLENIQWQTMRGGWANAQQGGLQVLGAEANSKEGFYHVRSLVNGCEWKFAWNFSAAGVPVDIIQISYSRGELAATFRVESSGGICSMDFNPFVEFRTDGEPIAPVYGPNEEYAGRFCLKAEGVCNQRFPDRKFIVYQQTSNEEGAFFEINLFLPGFTGYGQHAQSIIYRYKGQSGDSPSMPATGRLGGLDLARYCQSTGATVALGRDGIWYCRRGRDQYGRIEMDRACQWQYNKPAARAQQINPNDPHSWICSLPQDGTPPPNPQPPQQNTAPLKLFWSAARGDNFTTATAEGERSALSAGYTFVRIEGYVYPTQQPGTVPLKLYYSAAREDNYTTASAQGEQAALAAGYGYARVEGYVYPAQQPGTVPLKNYWDSSRGDNFTTATAAGERDALLNAYQFAWVEGYVLASESGSSGGSFGPTSLTSVRSGKCLDIEGGDLYGLSNGARANQWDCGGYKSQNWQLVAAGDGYYTIRTGHSGRCLDLAGQAKSNGTAVQQWVCHSGDSQKWQLVAAGGGAYSFKSKLSARCLDIEAQSQARGAYIHLWDCHNGNSQQWRLSANATRP
jgi:hypothetical protein